jgi:ribosome maturation factor RimP
LGKSSVIDAVEEIVEPIVSAEGLELVDVQYKKEGKNWYLRVFIDKEGGITVEDCQKISGQIGDLIEIENIISSEHIMEVSSPGLDRPLKTEKDFLRFKNKKIQASTFSPIDGQRNFKGSIADFVDNTLHLQTQKGLVKILADNIAKARLEIEI